MGRDHRGDNHRVSAYRVSIHAPCVGRDVAAGPVVPGTVWFQSTRPAWGATGYNVSISGITVFQSTRPAWGATVFCRAFQPLARFQSTRPAWGATTGGVLTCNSATVSIHAPCVGRDPRQRRPRCFRWCFNPRALRGARLGVRLHTRGTQYVSIHAPCVGRDRGFVCSIGEHDLVSIHAPCVGRDRRLPCHLPQPSCFNPRALRGARHPAPPTMFASRLFQSTRPAWGATFAVVRVERAEIVSIHAPCVGRDGS